MIHHIYSSLPTFKELKFHEGLNVLLATKEIDASTKQTRNGSGKSSFVEIVHFLMGGDVGKDSFLVTDSLKNQSFCMQFDLNGILITVERSAINKSKIHVMNDQEERLSLSRNEWILNLGRNMFKLSQQLDFLGRTPTFRSLFSYFARRQSSGAFFTPEKHSEKQQIYDYQIALMYLLGLDWKIASDWQIVRDKEKTLKELKKAAGSGAFGKIIGKVADLRTQLAVTEDRLEKIKNQVNSFRVLPQYKELELEADQITVLLKQISNDNTIDVAAFRDLEKSINMESPPPLNTLERIYAEVGVALPEITLKRYEEVQNFHKSIIRNRRQYLEEELLEINQRIEARELNRQKLDQRRAEIMNLLNSHGALEHFSMLQSEATRIESQVENLRLRFEAAEQMESTKSELEIDRHKLTLRLRRNFSEQDPWLREAILAFEGTSENLYEAAGSINIEETSNGPAFDFRIQGSRSKGIKNMQIFCFDMMIMKLCSERGISPGFLIHDSHLFDGVDGRQVISALKVGAKMAEEFNFQYIVTMNEDDAFKETIEGFNLENYILPVVLTDSTEDGGLFGIRF